MKKVFLSIVALAALVALPMSVSAQFNTSSVSDVPTKARVIRALSLTTTSEMNFGTFYPGTGGDITLGYTSGAIALDVTGSGVSRLTSTSGIALAVPSFTAKGEAGYNYNISVSGVTKLISPESNEMDIAISTTDDNGTAKNSGTLSGTFPAEGTETFYAKGVLTVGSSQASGAYVGSFDVTVQYN